MSTDTTPAAEAIRRLTSRLAEAIEMAPTYSYVAGDVDKDLEVLVAINRRADALDAELAAERARGKRLRRLAITAGDIIADGVTPERQQRYLYALAQCGGHHDLDEGGAA